MIFSKTSWIIGPTRVLIFTFSVLANVCMRAQSDHKTDSLIQLLITAAPDTNKVKILNAVAYRLMQTSDYIKAKSYTDEALTLNQQLDFRSGLADSYKIAGLIYESQGNYAESLKNHHFCLRINEEIGNDHGAADALSQIGLVYWHQGQYADAIQSYFTALKMYEVLSSKIGMARAYNNIAIIYDIQGNPSEALKNYEYALKIAEELNHEFGIAVCRTNIAIINTGQGDHTAALENHLAALETWKKIGEKSGVVNSSINIGQVYFCQSNFTEALHHYQASLNIAEEIGAEHYAASALIALGTTYIYLNQYPQAEDHLKKGLSLAKKVGAKEEIQKAYDGLSVLYDRMNNWQDAYMYYKQYVAYKDSLLNETTSEQIAQIKEQYESEKKDKEIVLLTNEKQQLESDKQISALLLRSKQDSLDIAQSEKEKAQLENEKFYALNLFNQKQIELFGNEKRLHELQSEKDKTDLAYQKAEADKNKEQLALLNKEREVQELKLKKEKLTKNYFIAGLGLFLVLSFFMYKNYHTRQELKLLTLRNKIAIDLHDDVGSTLSSISMFSQIAQAQSKESIPALETIGESSRKMLDAMADIVWTIKPENDEFDKVIMRMREFAFELLGAKEIDFEFDAGDDISKINLSMEARKNLYLIFKEATNNMVKYSEAKRAKFALKGEKDKLMMVISDNGKGFDTTKESRGNGLENMKKRAVEMGAQLLIDSTPGRGTTIRLDLAV